MKKQNQKGITLIALIITIIVMLILVAVTVTVAINGGLFKTAKEAVENTTKERDKELALSDGKIIYDWINGEPLTLPEGIIETEEWGDNENVVAITDGTKVVPLPKGYEIVEEEGKETTVANGLVIKDSKGNEFVWIPVETEFTSSYSSFSRLSEPRELTTTYSSSEAAYDSQATLTYLYGTKEDGTPYYSYPETEEEKGNANNEFAYKGHYAEMVESVNKYRGFYIGRYETTIDEETNEIGSKVNTIVLTADKSIPQTNNKQCRWYGLYSVQRNSNVEGNKEYVQTNMIWGQQWDAMLKFLGEELANSKIAVSQTGVLKSAEATYDGGAKDVMNNIYDLRRNANDWTAEAYSTNYRSNRGGYYLHSYSATYRNGYNPTVNSSYYSSRLTLYIR